MCVCVSVQTQKKSLLFLQRAKHAAFFLLNIYQKKILQPLGPQILRYLPRNWWGCVINEHTTHKTRILNKLLLCGIDFY